MQSQFLTQKKFLKDRLQGSTHIVYHIAVVGLSAAFALSLPYIANFVARSFLTYWSVIQNERLFLLSVELTLAILLILFTNYIGRSLKDRRLSKMARAAGLVLASPARGFFARRRIKKLKENQGFERDVMVLGSTGFRTFVDPKGDLHEVIQNCREAKVMLLNPMSEGARVRARSIANPGTTPETFGEQIRKSVDFLKRLKEAQKNIRLKLYGDAPFLKLSILGDYIWVQHYHAGLDIQMMPKFVFGHHQNPGSLYVLFYQYFLSRWEDPRVPEYDLDTDELIYRDGSGNEMRRERFEERKALGASRVESANHFMEKDSRQARRNALLIGGRCREHGRRADPFVDAWQSPIHELHSGGKEFSFLRPNHPMCETAGWATVL